MIRYDVMWQFGTELWTVTKVQWSKEFPGRGSPGQFTIFTPTPALLHNHLWIILHLSPAFRTIVWNLADFFLFFKYIYVVFYLQFHIKVSHLTRLFAELTKNIIMGPLSLGNEFKKFRFWRQRLFFSWSFCTALQIFMMFQPCAAVQPIQKQWLIKMLRICC